MEHIGNNVTKKSEKLMAKNEDAVGYGRPPRHTRFEPGVSGNPAGRPKKTPSFVGELHAELREESTTGVTKQRAMVRRLVAEAMAGNVRALSILVPILLKTEQSPDDDLGSLADREILEDFAKRSRRKMTSAAGDGNNQENGAS
jgi:Family of unknown function (DUF5681)